MIHIRQATFLLKGVVNIGETKNENSVRDILVPEFARASVRFLYDNANDYLLEGKNGRPIHPSTYRKFFDSALSQVEGVRMLKPHECRHTYITLLGLTGASIPTVQALSGQVDEETTILYMHKMDGQTVKAVGVLSSMLEGAATEASATGESTG